jgi:hypothetical protein
MTALKWIVVFALGVLGGYTLHSWNTPNPSEDPRFEQVQEKFKQLSENEFEEYMKIRDMKARYEKADEILGKIMTIFLMDLGLRASDEQRVKLQQSTALVTTGSETQPLAAQIESPTTSPTSRPNPSPTPPSQQPLVAPAEKPKPETVQNETDLKDFFDKAALKDADASWRMGGNLNNEQLQSVNGVFIGRAEFDESRTRPREPWDIQMTIQGQFRRGGNIRGSWDVKLFKNGKQFSHTESSQGSSLKHIKADKEGAILIEDYGGDAIYQLYYFTNLGYFAGNIYLRQGIGEFRKAGLITLRKQ